MLIALLILVSVSLVLNIICGIFLVRYREYTEIQLEIIQDQNDRLTKELLLRLPPRPYGLGDLGS